MFAAPGHTAGSRPEVRLRGSKDPPIASAPQDWSPPVRCTQGTSAAQRRLPGGQVDSCFVLNCVPAITRWRERPPCPGEHRQSKRTPVTRQVLLRAYCCNDDEKVRDLMDALQEVRGQVGHLLMRELALRKDVHNVGRLQAENKRKGQPRLSVFTRWQYQTSHQVMLRRRQCIEAFERRTDTHRRDRDIVYNYEAALSSGHTDWAGNDISTDSSDNDLDTQVY